ncbi:hypothetical protein A2U01_0107923, partial [Trifolium medium]|nr:hypothetical protein [Trifolium medium]
APGAKTDKSQPSVNPMNSDLHWAQKELCWAQMAKPKRAPQVQVLRGAQGYCAGRRSQRSSH